MKKVLLIARAKTPETRQKADAFADTIRTLLKDDIQIENCELSELFFELDQDDAAIYHPQKKFDLRDFDAVIIRHVGKLWVEAHAITVYCEHFGITYTDEYLNRLLLDNKVSTEFLLWSKGIRQWPRTMYGPVDELVKRLPELGEKAVLKDNEGSKGRHNFVVSSATELQAKSDAYPEKRFVLQEFIPNDSDLRVIVLNGKAVMAIRRSGDGASHLNNTSQGGSAVIVPIEQIDAEIISVCVEAARLTKLQVAGVDIMKDTRTGEFYLLEINNAPQISSGSFVEEKSHEYAKMVKDIVEKSAKKKTIIGRAEEIKFPTMANTPLYARIDTGAKTSSIWATDITETTKGLRARFLSPEHEIYQHEQLFEEFDRVNVASSMGQEQVRYRVKLAVIIGGRRVKATFTLSDRSTQVYPVLIGRTLLQGKFIVDVSQGRPLLDEERRRSAILQEKVINEE